MINKKKCIHIYLFIFHRYGLLVGDHYSGFCWGSSSEDKVSDHLIQFLLNLLVGAGFGCPEIILTDNGGELSNKIVTGCCNIFFNIIYLHMISRIRESIQNYRNSGKTLSS